MYELPSGFNFCSISSHSYKFHSALGLILQDVMNDPSFNETGIPEIDGDCKVKAEKRKLDEENLEPSKEPRRCKIKSQLPPILKKEYLDHVTKLEKISIVFLLYPETKILNFDVQKNNDVHELIVTYDWPELLTNLPEIFLEPNLEAHFKKTVEITLRTNFRENS